MRGAAAIQGEGADTLSSRSRQRTDSIRRLTAALAAPGGELSARRCLGARRIPFSIPLLDRALLLMVSHVRIPDRARRRPSLRPSREAVLPPRDAVLGPAAEVGGAGHSVEDHHVDGRLADADAARRIAEVRPHGIQVGTTPRPVEQGVHGAAARVARRAPSAASVTRREPNPTRTSRPVASSHATPSGEPSTFRSRPEPSAITNVNQPAWRPRFAASIAASSVGWYSRWAKRTYAGSPIRGI